MTMPKVNPGNKCKRYDTKKSIWLGVGEKLIALCPLCQKEYPTFIYFLGRGKPRLYCSSCLKYLRYNEFTEDLLGQPLIGAANPEFITIEALEFSQQARLNDD
jgi:hypothetical protein